ncbi:MAG: hypothetical protein KatS3mg068_0476 [Candidatus Sericytochromatia bacterium]|nr:MAG: hypothetical protein KatS3mg068_0476 [Candidatus Sericytochromatia bacterium]
MKKIINSLAFSVLIIFSSNNIKAEEINNESENEPLIVEQEQKTEINQEKEIEKIVNNEDKQKKEIVNISSFTYDKNYSYVIVKSNKIISIKKLPNNKHIEKAKEISNKLNSFWLEKKLSPSNILPAVRDKNFIIKSSNNTLFSIEKEIAINEKKSPYKITLEWTNSIRKALGSNPLEQRISRNFNRTISQIGYASWYGGKFHGRKTSSGEIFNMNSFTAAHRNLPLGTQVIVTNLDNGRSIIVKINDRGPFSEPGRRIIDLSKEAFKALSYLGKGIIRVKIEVL